MRERERENDVARSYLYPALATVFHFYCLFLPVRKYVYERTLSLIREEQTVVEGYSLTNESKV